MRTRWALFALLLGLGIGLAGVSRQAASADDDGDRIAKLVKQLGSTKFTERHRAKAALEAIGAPALEALRKAARSSDLETSRRAEEIVKKLQDKITNDSLLAPKKVRLNLKDTPVLDAVAELSKQSGYSIQLLGDRAALAGRKVTLDTGETTFWEAYDRLCQKAGLVEVINAHGMPYGGNPYAPRIGLPVQPVPPVKVQIQGGVLQIQPPPKVPLPPVKQILPPPAPKPLPLQGGAIQLQFNVQVQAVQVPAAPAQPAPAPKIAAPAPVQAPPAQAPAIPPPAPLQVKPLPAQIQPAPPVQIQPAPAVQIRPGVIRRPPVQPAPLGQLNLTDGKPQALPTCYAGAIRIRVVPQGQPGQAQVQPAPGRLQQIQPPVQPPAPPRRPGEVVLTLEVTPEPRMQQFNVSGSVQLDKATDEHGQKLTVPMDAPAAAPGPFGGAALGGRVYYYNPYLGAARTVQVALKLGEKPAKTLKEFSGQIPVQMLAPPQALITVENVLKAAGKTVKGAGGGSIEVTAVEKQADGNWKVQFRMEVPPGQILAPFPGQVQIMPAGQVQIQINGRGVSTYVNTNGLPALVDAKGKAFQLVGIPQRAWRGGIGGVNSQELTMVFRAHDGQGEPARMVLSGQRTVTVPVPFTFRDVRLP